MSNYKEYCHIENILAALFVEGMEDGFETRYYNDEDVHPDGRISTSSLFGEHEIKVPYVITKYGQKILSMGFNRQYLCIIDEVKSLMEINEFDNKFQLYK